MTEILSLLDSQHDVTAHADCSHCANVLAMLPLHRPVFTWQSVECVCEG